MLFGGMAHKVTRCPRSKLGT